MFYSRREVIIMMNTITLLAATSNIFPRMAPGCIAEKGKHVKRVIQVCAMIAVIVDNILADVLANS